MKIRRLTHATSRPPSILRKAATVLATVVLTGLTLMFSALLLAVIALAGMYLWWKTRKVRKQMRQQMQNFPPPRSATSQEEPQRGIIIEGEVTRVESTLKYTEKRADTPVK